MEQSSSGKANTSSDKNFRTFYGTRRFMAAFTTVHRLFLSSTRVIHSILSKPISLTSLNIILLCTLQYSNWVSSSGLLSLTLSASKSSRLHRVCERYSEDPDFINS